MFEKEYDLDSLQKIVPAGNRFEMLVTPRYLEHYTTTPYELLTTRLIFTQISENTIFVDIGAHFGFFSLFAGNATKAKKVMAFEPTPVTFEILKRNIELNHLQNVTLFDLAVSDKSGEVLFKVAEASDSSGFYDHVNCATREEIRVNAATLDSLLGDVKDTDLLVKIDAEGHEINILEGMRETIARLYPRIKLIVEYNPSMLAKAGREPGELISRLFALGFQVYAMDDASGLMRKIDGVQANHPHEELEAVLQPGGYVNLYCLPIQQSLNVVIFSHDSNLGGAERTLVPLVEDLSRKGVVCTVILPSENQLKPMLERAGVSTLCFPYSWWASFQKQNAQAWEVSLRDTFGRIYETLLPTLRQINPDIIVTNTVVIPWGAACAFLLNKPHVWYVHEFGGADHELQFFAPQPLIARYIEGASNTVITNSRAVTRHFFGEAPVEKVQTLYEILDEAPVETAPEKEVRYFFLENALKLAVIGTIQKGKGQIDALNAVKELVAAGENVELVLAGYHPDQEYYEILENEIRLGNLQTNVRILGFLENPFLLLRETDILLVCSQKEAFGRITLEAMRMGKPVIATDSGGTPELITDGETGLLYCPGDYRELRGKIKLLMDDPRMRQRLGQEAANFAGSRFLRQDATAKIFEILQSIRQAGNASSRDFTNWVLALLQNYIEASAEKMMNNFKINEQEALEARAAALNEAQSLEDVLDEKDRYIQSLQTGLVEMERSSDKLKTRLSELEQSTEALRTWLTERNRTNQALILQSEEQKAVILSLTNQVAKGEELARNLQAKLDRAYIDFYNTNMELIGYVLSTSWRVTRPLRKLKNLYRRVRGQ